MREQVKKVLNKPGTGQRVHVYKSGEVFYKDRHSTYGHTTFASYDAAIQYLHEMGWR